MKTVHLYGYLAEKYGYELKFEVNTIQELMKAMKANFKDWESTIRDDEFEVVVGKDLDANHLSEQELFLKFNNDFHIAPTTEGRKGGWFKVILGVVLIAIGVVLMFTPFAATSQYFIMGGIGMTLGGISQLIMGTPQIGNMDYAERERADERPSFLFKGGVNNVEQGGSVMLAYGEIMCGSTIVSTSILNEEMV